MLEREREANARMAAAEERVRLARELHDVVGHSVSVMVEQAGAERLAIGEERTDTREALLAIERTGREAYGPGRDRTCDLGIKSPARQHEARRGKLKQAANGADYRCKELQQDARCGGEPLRAPLRALVVSQGNKPIVGE
jgi:hypothetical protein